MSSRFSLHFADGACKSLPTFTRNSRLMLIAPHPDDEAIACGILLQRARRAGAAIRVVYATDGDNNPWPQRFLERKWYISAADRKRWGELRRQEALAALSVLDIDLSCAEFLALPDQGLTELLARDCRPTLARFEKVITDWAPTDLLIPSTADTHPDHNAVAVMLRLVLGNVSPSFAQMSVWSYAVHGASSRCFGRAAKRQQSESEAALKAAAIACHKTQLKLSRKRFLSYVDRPECFLRLDQTAALQTGSVRILARERHTLHLQLRRGLNLIGRSPPRLFIFGCDASGAAVCLTMRVPFGSTVAIPVIMFPSDHTIFVKLERRTVFFDEAGWLEVPAVSHPLGISAASRELEEALLAIH